MQHHYLTVSRIMVNNTNFPNSGTTRDVGGIISANRRKNTVNDRRMEIDKLTCNKKELINIEIQLDIVNSVAKWNLNSGRSVFDYMLIRTPDKKNVNRDRHCIKRGAF